MGLIGFTHRLAEVDDLKYFGQGGGLQSYYTDTLIQRVKGEIVSTHIQKQSNKIEKDKNMFYELLKLRKNISRPQLESDRIEVVSHPSEKKPNNFLVIKGDYTNHNPSRNAAMGLQ
jgi:hypothetical protein